MSIEKAKAELSAKIADHAYGHASHESDSNALVWDHAENAAYDLGLSDALEILNKHINAQG